MLFDHTELHFLKSLLLLKGFEVLYLERRKEEVFSCRWVVKKTATSFFTHSLGNE